MQTRNLSNKLLFVDAINHAVVETQSSVLRYSRVATKYLGVFLHRDDCLKLLGRAIHRGVQPQFIPVTRSITDYCENRSERVGIWMSA